MISQHRVLSRLVELADTLVAEFDVVDFLYTLSEAAVELLGAGAAGLMLADQRGHLQVVAASTQQARVLELFELQHDEGPCLDCYREGRPVANVDPAQAEERWPAFGAAVRAAHFASVHAVPLRLRDEVIGAMNLFLADRSTLTSDELSLAQALADIATIGLLQERAVREQQILAEQLQGALNSRTVIEQAKGVLAERHQLTLEAAFVVMRTHARRNGRPLLAVAAEVIDGTFGHPVWNASKEP